MVSMRKALSPGATPTFPLITRFDAHCTPHHACLCLPQGDRKWIGTTECCALLRYQGFQAEIVDFEGGCGARGRQPHAHVHTLRCSCMSHNLLPVVLATCLGGAAAQGAEDVSCHLPASSCGSIPCPPCGQTGGSLRGCFLEGLGEQSGGTKCKALVRSSSQSNTGACCAAPPARRPHIPGTASAPRLHRAHQCVLQRVQRHAHHRCAACGACTRHAASPLRGRRPLTHAGLGS